MNKEKQVVYRDQIITEITELAESMLKSKDVLGELPSHSMSPGAEVVAIITTDFAMDLVNKFPYMADDAQDILNVLANATIRCYLAGLNKSMITPSKGLA